jgi:hypothetical protein
VEGVAARPRSATPALSELRDVDVSARIDADARARVAARFGQPAPVPDASRADGPCETPRPEHAGRLRSAARSNTKRIASISAESGTTVMPSRPGGSRRR